MRILIILCNILVLNSLFGQELALNWNASFDLEISSPQVTAMDEDSLGNLYITGQSAFYSYDYDPGTGVAIREVIGGGDFFILKMHANGDFAWAQVLGGSGADEVHDLVIDREGNVFVTGTFSGTADFDAGSATNNLTASAAENHFLLKLDSEGNYLWAKNFESQFTSPNIELCVDHHNNVLFTGYFQGNFDFDPGAGTANASSPEPVDLFVSKYSNTGEYIWAKTFGGSIHQIGMDIAIDSNDNVFVAGTFFDTVDFDPGPSEALAISNGDRDCFLLKLDAAGNYAWMKYFGSEGIDDEGRAVALDPLGNVWFSGSFTDTVYIDNVQLISTQLSLRDAFLAKYDNDGNLLRAQSFGGPGLETVIEMETDAESNCFISGSFKGTPDFDPGSGNYTIVAEGDEDAFLLKLDESGDFLWAKAAAGIYNQFNMGMSVGDGTVSLAGNFNGYIDLSLGEDATIDGSGSVYVKPYIAKYVVCQPVSSSMSAESCVSYHWDLNNMTYTQSGQYSTVLSTFQGCDSIVYLNLTIRQPQLTSSAVSSCDSYLWMQTGEYLISSGMYYDTLSNIYGCDSIIALNLTIVSDTVIISAEDNILTAVQPANATFQWYDCTSSQIISGETGASFSPTLNGSYALLATYNGCTDLSECVVISNVSLTEQSGFFLEIYPNPAGNQLFLDSDKEGIYTYTIINNLGQKIIVSKVNLSHDWIDISTLENGSYCILIEKENMQTKHFFSVIK